MVKRVSKRAWSGRFKKDLSKSAEIFTSSIGFDHRLASEDIVGSIVFSKALFKAHVLDAAETKKIVTTLQEILKSATAGRVKFSTTDEDIHMNIERMLVERVGEIGKKLHTGRSRNDQVATDLRMYLKKKIIETLNVIRDLQVVLLDLSDQNVKVVMPGYTHLQRAQPILLSHHLMAYFEMLERDVERFMQAYVRTDHLPLGAAALSGTSFAIDREFIAGELGFNNLCRNSIDAVSDRDFVLDFLAASSILMMHLSRFCEELVIWSSYEFDFVEISDAYATGSSIMPQKKNPDVAELIRGKSGRVYGSLMAMLTMMKGLPLAYNKDYQEDKEATFDTIDTVISSVTLFKEMLATLKFNKEKLLAAAKKGFLNATDLAYYLVRKGVPFRDAHEVVGKIIAYCEEANMELEYMSLQELKKFSDQFGYDAQGILSVESSIESKDVLGATSSRRVKEAIKEARKRLSREK